MAASVIKFADLLCFENPKKMSEVIVGTKFGRLEMQ
jgi:hypothetical protein